MGRGHDIKEKKAHANTDRRRTGVSNRGLNAAARIKSFTSHTMLYIILSAFAVLFIFPFLYMILASFRSRGEMREFAHVFYLIPKEFTLDAYKELFAFNPNQFSFLRGLANTMIVESSYLFAGLFVDVMIAYGFAKVKFKGRDAALIVCLLGPPFIVTLMPQYTMWSSMGLVGTFLPLILPNFLGTMGVVFYLERYMKSLPNEIFEAATVDGLGHWGKIWRIAFPLSMPAIVVQTVFTFLGIWNDLLGPELYLTSVKDKTLQIMLQSLTAAVDAGRASDQPLIMAAATLSSLPILVLYLSCQHLFVNSMAAAAVKG